MRSSGSRDRGVRNTRSGRGVGVGYVEYREGEKITYEE